MNFPIKNSYSQVFWTALLVTGMSCSRSSCPVSAGEAISDTRVLPAFSTIALYDKINLVLTEDSIQSVTISGDKNLLPGIHTVVSDSTLTIESANVCNFLRDPGYEINVYVSTSRLKSIQYYGAGRVSSSNTLFANQFTVDSWSGTGSINLQMNCDLLQANVRNANATISVSGQADQALVYCSDAGSVNLADLSAVTVQVDQKSVRDSYVNVSGFLQAEIVYRGNLYYKGSPSTVDTLITSTGKLIHMQ